MDSKYWIDFILAGKSNFRLQSARTGKEFEYLVDKAKNSDNLYFVNVNGVYSGVLVRKGKTISYKQGKGGKIPFEDERIKGLMYVLEGKTKGVILRHFGKCGRCGRNLKDKESAERGIGPECIKKLI